MNVLTPNLIGRGKVWIIVGLPYQGELISEQNCRSIEITKLTTQLSRLRHACRKYLETF